MHINYRENKNLTSTFLCKVSWSAAVWAKPTWISFLAAISFPATLSFPASLSLDDGGKAATTTAVAEEFFQSIQLQSSTLPGTTYSIRTNPNSNE